MSYSITMKILFENYANRIRCFRAGSSSRSSFFATSILEKESSKQTLKLTVQKIIGFYPKGRQHQKKIVKTRIQMSITVELQHFANWHCHERKGDLRYVYR